MASFPQIRMRRLRQNSAIRNLLRETSLTPQNLIAPIFVVPGVHIQRPIATLAGYFHLSPDEAAKEAQCLWELGIQAVLLFGLPSFKDRAGSAALDDMGIVQEAIRMIRKNVPEMLVMADLCLCEYTDHGHCGIVVGETIDNDATLAALQEQALSLAHAGAQVIAPSGMMDGMVKALRITLDQAGFIQVMILSYAAKFASSFYGPFRQAVDSTPLFGNRETYQMDPANAREAMREVLLDIEEGADMVMIKPAMPYLDILWQIRTRVQLPLVAYQVSGEYAMIKLAASHGLIDGSKAMYESLLAIKRAGADLIISYFAKEFASR